MRLFRHSLSQRIAALGTDVVIGGCLVPSEGSLNNVWGDCHVIGLDDITHEKAALYGLTGYVVHEPDPDNTQSFDTLWDVMVPKDTDVASGALDLSTGSADVSPEFEPGEPNIERMMDGSVLDDDNMFFKRRKMITFASSPSGFDVGGTPDSYIPTDRFRIRSGKKVNVDLMSVALLGFSSPQMDDTTTTIWTTPSDEAVWMQLKYIDMVLEQAFVQLIGLTEAGAETPWEDAATMLEDFLEPTVVEQTAADFASEDYNVFTSLTFDISVPGVRKITSVSAS